MKNNKEKKMKKELTNNLNKYLANLGVLYIKLHNLHWNVVGINFKAIHEYYETLYDGISASLDSVAEIIKMHEQIPLATLKSYLEASDIKELESLEIDSKKSLKIVLEDFIKMKSLIEQIRKDADQEDLYDIVTLMENDLEQYTKSIWFIRAMLK